MSVIERIQCGNGNCYLVYEGSNAILVDTSRTRFRERILQACKKKKVTLIVLTHGHVDHIQNAAFLSKELNAPIAMHKADYALSQNNMLEPLTAHTLLGKLVLALSIKSFQQDEIEAFEPEVYLREGNSLEHYGINATVIELPGHTNGSIGLIVDETDIIVGDALMNLFYPSRSKLYGDRDMMEKSVKKLSDYKHVRIHFGHGKSVTNKNW
ncbi:MBL fold metallo-hydrolase [Lacrimispora amygdalina]|uniref:MBL fold metallo-hydrolase n=1 Tax=Lacrimispora amygdalina TaxID=253257 RepID=A0A3E2N3Q5_9FIRM|nr:MBL fold metallo-hydrolase [Clostridium indicum]RFZ75613.1 MBL fold metallo-hydrolase [Clostridium indicum]